MKKNILFYLRNPSRFHHCLIWGVGILLSVSVFGYAKPFEINLYSVASEDNSSFQQTKEVKGTVLSADDNSPVTGATVRLVGKSDATSTDDQGDFVLQVAIGDVLEVSSLGFKSTRVTIRENTSVIVVTLDSDRSNLDEVVVTGYGTQRKKDLTGSVAVVDVAELKAQPASSAVEALQGKAPGVQIVNEGAPGSTAQIKIRGYSTINNNEPLYIIDGVPHEGKLTWLNHNDIESMQVLKDASAASIYGARANNGVIIITTKSGQKGKPQITFESKVGLNNPQYNRFPKMLTPQQVVDLDNEIRGVNNTLPDYLLAGTKTGHEITLDDVDMSKYNYTRDPTTFYSIVKTNKEGTDWFREISQRGMSQDYQLSATGGSDHAAYAMSGGYLKQKGTIIHSGFERFNIRTNTKFDAFDGRFRFGENLQYSYTEGFGMGVNPNTAGAYMDEGSVIGWAYRSQTAIPVYDEGGNFAGSRGGYGNARNPVAFAYRGKDNINKNNFFFGNAFGEVDIVDGLFFRTSFGLKYETWSGRSISYPTPERSEGSFTNNSLSENQGYGSEWTWTNTLNYTQEFDLHRLSAIVGTEAISNNSHSLSGSRNDFFILNSLDYFYLDAGTSNFGNSSSGSIGSMYSIFGKVDYSYDERYILSATVRRDGSSNFGPENKFGVFPGVSAAWRISSEEFARNADWLNDLKFRIGYGVTGNQRIPSYNYVDRFASSLTQSSYPIGGGISSGLWQSDYANEQVKWEQVNAFNVGLDFSVLEGDFDGSIDYYDKKTKDMLFRVPLPAIAVGGAASPYVNVGSMRNHGLEFSLNYHYGYKQGKDFTFDISATWAKNINNVTALAPSVSQQVYGNFRNITTTVLRTGDPFGSFYGFRVAGVYRDDEDVANSPNYSDGGARPGGLKYVDINGDGVINDDDRTIIGNPHPDFTYSLGFNSAYKAWDVLLSFYGSQGNDVFNMVPYYTDFGVFNGARSVRLLDAWSPTNPESKMPSLTPNPSSYEQTSSDYYVEDGSFLKLKNLQVGYTLPLKNWSTMQGLQKLRVYLGVTNVFTLTKYRGIDPEVSATPSDYPAIGVDMGTYPQSRQFLLGLNIGF